MKQIGLKSIYLDVIDSTNNYTANLIKNGEICHGTVIMADEQTNGRGQRGAVWQTAPGLNLIFSLYLEHDKLAVERQDAIHHFVALSITELLTKIGISSVIKWPNDILTANGKIAGVLIENSLQNQFIKHSIIGVGLNVNQLQFDGVDATSVKMETGCHFNIKEFAAMFVASLNSCYPMLINGDFETLKDRYLSKMWGMNKEVRFIRNDQMEEGIIVGTNDMGLLSIITKNGLENLDIKEAKFIIESLI